MIKNIPSIKWLIAAALLTAGGCAADKELMQTGLINEWLRTEQRDGTTDVYILEFESGNDFVLRLNESESSGTFRIRGKQLIIESESCGTAPGIYNFSLSDAGVLTISIAEDFCGPRIQHLVGKWLKK